MDLLGSMDWKKGNLTPETDVFYCFLPSMGGEVSGEDFPLNQSIGCLAQDVKFAH